MTRRIPGACGGGIRHHPDAGVLDDTIIIFTSDNGLSLGDHRVTFKGRPYAQQFRAALVEIKRVEQEQFLAQVSPLEYDSYLVLA